MHTSWHIHRTVRAQRDGERRWDYAYQFLLQWVMEQTAGNSPASSHQHEESHGSRSVHPCLDASSATAADD